MLENIRRFVTRKSSAGRASAVREDALAELASNPQTLDTAIDLKISRWEEAWLEYEALEATILSKHAELGSILEAIREEPQDQSLPVELKPLTELRQKLVEIEAELAGKRERPTSTRISSARMTSPDVKEDDREVGADGSEGEDIGFLIGRLSSIYSKRFNSINTTQGSVHMPMLNATTKASLQSADDGAMQSNQTAASDAVDATEALPAASTAAVSPAQLKIVPKWPDFLVNVSYDVIKVNKYGHRMRRILKFTHHHVISVRNGNEVTKFYRYGGIRRVGLLSSTSISITYRNDRRNLFVSPIAPHILQQLITRIQVRRTLDKANFQGLHTSSDMWGYDVTSAAQVIKVIAESNSSDAEAVVAAFATHLKERALTRHKSAPMGMTSVSASDLEQEVKSPFDHQVSAAEAPPGPPAATSSPKITTQSTAASFTRFAQSTPEYAVQAAARAIIYDANTPEGNTRRVFLTQFEENYAALQRVLQRLSTRSLRENSVTGNGGANSNQDAWEDKSGQECAKSAEDLLVDVRHFIDGMHEHMVSARAFSFMMIYQSELQRGIAKVDGNEEVITLSGNHCKFLSSSKKFLRNDSLRFLADNDLGPEIVDENLLTMISYIIFTVVEEATFLALKDKLVVLVAKDDAVHDMETTIVEKIRYFAQRTQKQWGIGENFVSALDWKTAAFELSSLEHNLIPSSQLNVLIRTVKAIYNEFKFGVLPQLQSTQKNGKENVCMGADDLVPIFLYVLCHSTIQHPLRNRDLMWALGHPDQLHGEAGYYLTVYESALEFILNEPIEGPSFLIEDKTRGMLPTVEESTAIEKPQPSMSIHSQRSLSIASSAQRRNESVDCSCCCCQKTFLSLFSFYRHDQDLMMRESFA